MMIHDDYMPVVGHHNKALHIHLADGLAGQEGSLVAEFQFAIADMVQFDMVVPTFTIQLFAMQLLGKP